MKYDEFKAKYSDKMPKARKALAHPEDDLQRACVRWFKEEAYPQLAPLLFHPNNEPYFGAGKTAEQKAKAGARAKSMGVTPGVADLILLRPGDLTHTATGQLFAYTSHALCIELKTKEGRQSDAQREWESAVNCNGYNYVVCRTLEQFQRTITDYLGIPPKDPEQAAIDRIFGDSFKARVRKASRRK